MNTAKMRELAEIRDRHEFNKNLSPDSELAPYSYKSCQEDRAWLLAYVDKLERVAYVARNQIGPKSIPLKLALAALDQPERTA